MREIKFRGKRVDTNEWVYGFCVTTQDTNYICYSGQFNDDLFLSPQNIMIPVIPSTIGQFTDLNDKNGREIYEGDNIRIVELTDTEIRVYETDVKWEECAFVIKSGIDDYYDAFLAAWAGNPLTTSPMFQLEVIGNIHDNPELLKA